MPKAIFCLYIEATEEQAKALMEYLEARGLAFYDATSTDITAISATTIEDVECWIEGK